MASPEIQVDINTIDDLEFERRTLEAIRREFGLGGLARFLMTHHSGKGDYTAERQANPDPRTIDEVLRDLEAYQSRRNQ